MILRRALLCPLLFATIASADPSYELTPDQTARIEKFLPRTYPKLVKRAPVHTVTIGDSILLKWGYDEDNANALKAWGGVFLQELADQFIYTGGVRIVRPPKGQPEKLEQIHGPEITMQNFSRGGRQIFHALQPLTSVAFENSPDLIIVSYGINDAMSQLPLSVYRRNVQDIVDLAKAHSTDLILCGPSAILNDPPSASLALTRPYADTMREVAESNGVYFADLGDLSWLIELKTRKDPLAALKKKKADPAADATSTGEDGTRDLQRVVDLMKPLFNHGTTVDLVHPDTAAHRVLGRRVFRELIDGPKPFPVKTERASFTLEGDDRGTLAFDLVNPSATEKTCTLTPLTPLMWTPQTTPAPVVLPPNGKQRFTIAYARAGRPDALSMTRGDLFTSDEPLVRIPILIKTGSTVRIVDLRATLTPLAVLWDAGTRFNVEGAAKLDASIANTTGASLEGRWTATWMGQIDAGKFTVEPNAQTPVRLSFRMPAPPEPGARLKGTVALKITVGQTALRFERELEVVRNIALQESVPLVSGTSYLRDEAPKFTGPGVTLRAEADAQSLKLTYDLKGFTLQDGPNGAVALDVSLDARSYGKRLMPGATEVVRASVSAADGPGRVAPMQAWTFGTGYNLAFDEKLSKVTLTTQPDGTHRVVLTLPRSYFQLHEWALGNGNSQLGINTSIQIGQPGADAAKPGANATFGLTFSGRQRDDAESLAVLELADKPTGRWTVRLY